MFHAITETEGLALSVDDEQTLKTVWRTWSYQKQRTRTTIFILYKVQNRSHYNTVLNEWDKLKVSYAGMRFLSTSAQEPEPVCILC